MARLGVEREQGVAEPEDHIASLCEMMAGFIDGSLGPPLSLEEQKGVLCGARRIVGAGALRDMEEAKTSVLYAALGSVGRVFLAIEERAFAMA